MLYYCASLVWWLLYKYKYLWDVGTIVEIQVSRKDLHTHIYLDYAIL